MAQRPSKRRKIIVSSEKTGTGAVIQKAYFKSAASWDLEERYAAKQQKKRKDTTKLPIKTADGQIKHAELASEEENDEEYSAASNEEWLDSATGGQGERQDDQLTTAPAKPDYLQILEAKEELAKIATTVNEDPEENSSAFRMLAKIGASPIIAIQKLALLTQLAVYRDVIPGYKIRPVTEEAAKEKVSKEVRKLRQYEQALVSGYQAYVKKLAVCAKLDPSQSRGLSTIALKCACTLVTSAPHFNFRGDLLRILIGKLSKLRVDEDFVKCRDTMQTLFAEDEDGNSSKEAVALLNKMMKARNYRVDESVVNLFLHLRLLRDYSPLATEEDGTYPKLKKKQREFRTKKERKRLKEDKALEKDMALADAQVDYEERERIQSEILTMVFAMYFRILKARSPRLMGAVLEGLAKYAHLINMDFFGDLLEAMRDLIKHADSDAEGVIESDDEDGEDENIVSVVRNTSREALLCSVTAFTLLDSQHAAKARTDPQLDLPFFQNHLYQALLPLAANPDIEFSSKSLRLPGPESRGLVPSKHKKINLQTTTVLLLKCLTAVLLPTFNIRAVPATRLAAFSKQLMTISLQIPEKSARAILVLLCDVAKFHGKKIVSLWNTEERLGDGTFRALATSPEMSNPFAATIWEGELLKKHFCPEVREGIKKLEKVVDGAVSGQ